jgi:hypothetical protein
MTLPAIEARAQRLLRCYPARWRQRYGEEFAEMLVAQIEDEPRSWRRTADVVRGGINARLSLAGLSGGPIYEPRLALATTGAAITGFTALGISLWSQLVIGAHNSTTPPAAGAGMVVLTLALCYLAVLAVLAAMPIVGATVQSMARRERRGLFLPVTMILASGVALVAGGRHLATHWHVLVDSGSGAVPIPDSAASFGWAETFTISTFWAHPRLLLAMPLTRLGWMVLSPLALVAGLVAVSMLLRRLDLSASVLRYEARLAKAAIVGMIPMLSAAAWWVFTSQHNADAGLRAGSLDVLLIAVMAAAVTIALLTTSRVREEDPRTG